jgi:hypothetical protein
MSFRRRSEGEPALRDARYAPQGEVIVLRFIEELFVPNKPAAWIAARHIGFLLNSDYAWLIRLTQPKAVPGL